MSACCRLHLLELSKILMHIILAMKADSMKFKLSKKFYLPYQYLKQLGKHLGCQTVSPLHSSWVTGRLSAPMLSYAPSSLHQCCPTKKRYTCQQNSVRKTYHQLVFAWQEVKRHFLFEVIYQNQGHIYPNIKEKFTEVYCTKYTKTVKQEMKIRNTDTNYFKQRQDCDSRSLIIDTLRLFHLLPIYTSIQSSLHKAAFLSTTAITHTILFCQCVLLSCTEKKWEK